VKTFRWTRVQGRVFHRSIGAVASVVIASPPRLVPLPSTLPCRCQQIAGRSPARWLLRPSLALAASGCHLRPTGESREGVTPFLDAVCHGVEGRTVRRDTFGRPSGAREEVSSRSPCPFGAKPITHVGLFHITTILKGVRVPTRAPLGSAGFAGGFSVTAFHARFIALRVSRSHGAWASPWHLGERNGPSTAPK
jgi:hypothetical protein